MVKKEVKEEKPQVKTEVKGEATRMKFEANPIKQERNPSRQNPPVISLDSDSEEETALSPPTQTVRSPATSPSKTSSPSKPKTQSLHQFFSPTKRKAEKDPESVPSPSKGRCPICQAFMPLAVLDSHANKCIDRISS